jgi:hypothetical protein
MATKGFLQSTTVVSSLSAIALSAGIYLTPKAAAIAVHHYPEKKSYIQAWQNLIVETCSILAMGSGGLAIAGRVAATSRVSTPGWLPGPNKADLEEVEIDSEIDRELKLQNTVEVIVKPLIEDALISNLEKPESELKDRSLKPEKPDSKTGRAFVGRMFG